MPDKSKSVVIAQLDHLNSALQEALLEAKTPEGWDQEAVQKVVRHEYDFLGPFITARVDLSPEGTAVLVVELSTDPSRDLAKAERTFEEATAKADRGDVAGARMPLGRLVEEFPEVAKYRRALGQAYLELGDPENAEDELLKALQLDPLDGDAHTILGNIYVAKGRRDRAIVCYRRSLALERSVFALNGLGAALAQTGEGEEAIRVFKDAVDADPTYPHAWYGLGVALSGKRDPKLAREAIQSLDQCLQSLGQRYASPQLWDAARQHLLGLVPVEAQVEAPKAKQINEEIAERESDRWGTEVELVTSDDLRVLGKIEYSWVHHRPKHRITMQRAAVPEREHHVRHELEHLRLANLARAAGRNRWFASNELTKDQAMLQIREGVEKLSRSLPPEAASGFLTSVYHGLMGQLYNFPVDLLIEKRLLSSHPELRELVFYSVWKQLEIGAQAAHDPQLQELTPSLILEANAAMNGAFSLWLEDEFPNRTDLVDRFSSALGWGKAQDLHEIWQDVAATWSAGDELDWVDRWAEELELAGWYYWIEDETQPG